MAPSMPTDNPLFGNPTKMMLDSKFGTHAMLFPDVDNTRRHVERIFKGVDYRVLPIDGYKVESIVDVGANIGAFAVYMAIQFPDARIFCFEPSSEAFEYLEENTKTFSNIETQSYGLFSEDCEKTLYDGAAQGLQNSLYKSVESSDTGKPVQLKNAKDTFSKLRFERISILKIDTEGAEVPILESLSDFFDRIDQIYVEYHSEEDRREIETLLGDTHVLAGALSGSVHLGLNHYLSASVIKAFPHLELRKIERS